MEVIKYKRRNKVTDLILDRQVITGKRIISLFVPVANKPSGNNTIRDSKVFGGETLGS